MNKQQYTKWLAKRGLLPTQLAAKKKRLGSPNVIPNYASEAKVPLSNTIPGNGTKSPDISKSILSKKQYDFVPTYNKGPIQPVKKATR